MLIDFRQLFPKWNIKPQGILHIGANVGEEACVYHELGIQHVTWIEANPEIYQKLKLNLNQYPGQIAFNYCIGDEDKDTILHISNNGSQSSSVLELGTHRIVHPDVHYVANIPLKMNRIDTLYREGKLPTAIIRDFVNCDIQGAELMALKGFGSFMDTVKWLYLEINQNELYQGCATVDQIDEYVRPLGFRRVETKWCGNTGWGDGLYCR